VSIAPINKSVRVKADPARAFDLFVNQMARWWPRGIGKNAHAAIVVEPREGGRWFERDAEGNETQWGKVLAWEPPARLLLAWQISSEWRYDPDVHTEVELRFTAAEGGGTLVMLEHRKLEQFGKDAAKHSDRLRGGWPTHLEQYGRFADAHT
jgi:uncharacterized protein YndB with AHSA1/START domain